MTINKTETNNYTIAGSGVWVKGNNFPNGQTYGKRYLMTISNSGTGITVWTEWGMSDSRNPPYGWGYQFANTVLSESVKQQTVAWAIIQ